MKLIIELKDETYKFYKENALILIARGNGRILAREVYEAIKNSKPYDDSGDLISREALRKEVTEKVNFTTVDGHIAYDKMLKLIDNAPTVETERQGEKINEIPKDFVYDTETSDFYCYRNKYTGEEIHILKEPKTYTLERPQGDCISREALKDIAYINKGNFNTVEGIREWIDNAQAIPLPNEQIAWEQGYEAGLAQGKNDRPKGEWIDHSETDGYVECPFCGSATTCEGNKEELHFCFNCGAEMKGGVE